MAIKICSHGSNVSECEICHPSVDLLNIRQEIGNGINYLSRDRDRWSRLYEQADLDRKALENMLTRAKELLRLAYKETENETAMKIIEFLEGTENGK